MSCGWGFSTLKVWFVFWYLFNPVHILLLSLYLLKIHVLILVLGFTIFFSLLSATKVNFLAIIFFKFHKIYFDHVFLSPNFSQILLTFLCTTQTLVVS